MSGYHDIKQVNDMVSGLSKNVYISGGTAPYLLTDTKSKRDHANMDYVVDAKNIDAIRNLFKAIDAANGNEGDDRLYKPELDSKGCMNADSGKPYPDCGFKTTINGVEVGFYPFEETKQGITQRRFSIEKGDMENGHINIESTKYPDIKKSDYVCERKNGQMAHQSMEFIFADKMSKPKTSQIQHGCKDRPDMRMCFAAGLDKDKVNMMATTIAKQEKANIALNIEDASVVKESYAEPKKFRPIRDRFAAFKACFQSKTNAASADFSNKLDNFEAYANKVGNKTSIAVGSVQAHFDEFFKDCKTKYNNVKNEFAEFHDDLHDKKVAISNLMDKLPKFDSKKSSSKTFDDGLCPA